MTQQSYGKTVVESLNSAERLIRSYELGTGIATAVVISLDLLQHLVNHTLEVVIDGLINQYDLLPSDKTLPLEHRNEFNLRKNNLISRGEVCIKLYSEKLNSTTTVQSGEDAVIEEFDALEKLLVLFETNTHGYPLALAGGIIIGLKSNCTPIYQNLIDRVIGIDNSIYPELTNRKNELEQRINVCYDAIFNVST